MSAAEKRARWGAVVSGLVVFFSVILPLEGDCSAAEMIFENARELTDSFWPAASMRLLIFATPYMLAATIAAREWAILRRWKPSFEVNVILAAGMTAAIAGGALLSFLFASELGFAVMAWTGLFMVALPFALLVLAFRTGGFRRVFETAEVAGAGISVWWAGIVIWEIHDGLFETDFFRHSGALVLGLSAFILFTSLVSREWIIVRRAGPRR